MNYLLKRQPSPARLVESVLNSTTLTTEKHCICRNCLQQHAVFRRNAPFRTSSYISALKIQLEKSKSSRKNEKITRKEDSASKKLTEMLKVMPPKQSTKRMILYKKKLVHINEALGSTGRFIVDCTKSYDPNLLNCNPEMEDFTQLHSKNSMIKDNTNLNNSESVTNHKVMYRELSQLKNSTLEENQNPEDDILVYNPQRPGKNVGIQIGSESKIKIPLDPLENSVKEPIVNRKKKEIQSMGIPQINFTSDYVFSKVLFSSIDICITNSMIKEAYQLFESYRRKSSWKRIVDSKSKIIQDVYNSLLFALSSKGYWCLTQKVLKCMDDDMVKLNSASFAALLNCLANVRKSGNNTFVLEEVSKILNLIFKNNIPLNNVFCEAVLLNGETEEILAIIREVIPSFEMKPNVMELSSNCILLKNLNMGPTNLQPQLEGVGIEEMKGLVKEQLEMEKKFYFNVKAVSRGQHGEVPQIQKERLEDLKQQWRDSLTKAVNKLRQSEGVHFSNSQNVFSLHIYLNSLPVEKFVDILMETTQSLVEFSGGFSPSTAQFRKTLGMKVSQCYYLRKKDVNGITDKVEHLFKKYMSWYVNPSGPARNSRQIWQMVIQDTEKSNQLDMPVVEWPDLVMDKLGGSLLDIILKEVKFNVTTEKRIKTSPVFYTILRHRGNTYREEIKCHPTVAGLFESVGFDVLNFPCEEVPMVCPPRPWRAHNDGGYLFLNTDFIRKKFGVQGRILNLKDVPVQQLYATLDSLNALQSVPWKINEDVLDVALEVFQNGGSEKLSVPLFPQKPPPPKKWTNLSFEERRKEYMQTKEIVKELANNYSLWCEALYRLSLANHFRKRIFWMPQNCDFRGRVYPVPPLVNHLGSDLFRSLLIFAKGKPLGPKGLDWLKIHLINLTGTHKKKSIKDRLNYANEILPDILDSAENPLMGGKWWMESEEPWQTLASCMELKKALSVPNPETYLCRFPIHQDGSCNGLQHYAALGKDVIGAKSVNLTPCDKPQDVYNVVVELIEQERSKDASEGLEIAKILEGFVERKVVKQTIMTTVYGVTNYGAKLQIAKRLEEIPNFPKEYVNPAAAYLTNRTFLSLKKMFTSAKQIQDWFINCAKEICQRGEYVQWMSPMGLPVLQCYAKYKVNSLKSNRVLVPDIMKQRNAFPPNFIHSLDSCHMMLTSLYCEQAGLTFAAVHDCFWTHPSTADIMNRICREQFISLHSQSILEELSQFFKKTYGVSGMSETAKKTFESVPEKGSFDVREVLNSVYFFS